MSKTYLLSGASSGIGAKVYEKLISNGHHVIPIVRNKKTATNMGVTEYLECDMSDTKAAIESVFSLDRTIDGFINCAGVAIGKPIWDCTVDEINNLMNVNLISPMVISGALKDKFNNDSLIIFLSSRSAYGGGWDDAYIASKGGVNSIVKSLAIKFAPFVRVIGIAPGVISDTRMTNERKQDDLDGVINKIPLKMLGTPDQISSLILAMLGDAGSHITGAMIDVNGGAYLR